MAYDLEDTRETLEAFAATLNSMSQCRVDRGGEPQAWNRLVNELQRLQLDLRQTEQGQAGISELMDSDDETVRTWCATFALFWDEPRARAVLQAEVEAAGMAGFESEIALREFDAGRLNMTWEPLRRKNPRVSPSPAWGRELSVSMSRLPIFVSSSESGRRTRSPKR